VPKPEVSLYPKKIWGWIGSKSRISSEYPLKPNTERRLHQKIPYERSKYLKSLGKERGRERNHTEEFGGAVEIEKKEILQS